MTGAAATSAAGLPRRRALGALATVGGWGALLALPLAPGLAGCASAELAPQLPGPLQGQAGWAVSGRLGWLPQRQPLRFGPYATGERTLGDETRHRPCSQGCHAFEAGAWALALRTRLSTTRQALRFRQHGPAGQALDVQALAVHTREEREWTWRALGLRFSQSEDWQSQGPWTGLLEPASPGPQAWRFAIDDGGPGPGVRGHAQSEGGQRLVLGPMAAAVQPGAAAALASAPAPALAHPARLWPAGWWIAERAADEAAAGGPEPPPAPARALAAVLAVGEGRVWLRDGLDAERALVAAALASVLLLRPLGAARNLL